MQKEKNKQTRAHGLNELIPCLSFYLHSIPTDMKCKLINKRHHLHEITQKHTNKRMDGL